MTTFLIILAIASVTIAIAVVGSNITENLESISSHLNRIARAAEYPEDLDEVEVTLLSEHSPDVIGGKERKGNAVNHSGSLTV